MSPELCRLHWLSDLTSRSSQSEAWPFWGFDISSMCRLQEGRDLIAAVKWSWRWAEQKDADWNLFRKQTCFRFLLWLFKTNKQVNITSVNTASTYWELSSFLFTSPNEAVTNVSKLITSLWWSCCTRSMTQAGSAVSAGWMMASTSKKDQQKCRGGSGVSSVSFQSVIVPKLLAALPLHRCCSPEQTQKAPMTVPMRLPNELLFRRSVIHIVELSGFVWTHIWASHSEFLQRHISSFCCLINDHVLLFFQFLPTCTLCSNSFTSIWSQGADSVY